MNKLTTETFIEKAKNIHGDKYDYSKVDYENSHKKICIICKKHGEFYQTPNSHLRGSGCPMCCEHNHKYTLNDFIEKAKKIHGDKYDYSKVEYVNNEIRVCISCPEHGEFWQRPANHLFGQGCPRCSSKLNVLKYTTDSIIEKFILTHGDRYDYSKVKYDGITKPVTIICPEHGEFLQTPSLHLKGCGCPTCGNMRSNKAKLLTTETFIEKAKKIHGDKYDYSKVEYIGYDTPVTIICPEHGEFLQTPDSHLQGKGCNSCSIRHSGGEDEIIDFIQSNSSYYVEINNRTLIKPYELDIYIPELKIAIEYNGIRWHTEEFGKDKNYHITKLEMCNKLGIKLIQIFEDEFINHKEIVLHKLSHLLNLDNNKPKIFARKCEVKRIKMSIAKDFLENYHIQGFAPSTIHFGCFYEHKLIGVMSFKKVKDEWELTRFASDYNYICCGIGGKLLKHFIREYKPKFIKSFADRRWTINENDNIYTKLGFELHSILKPDYRYVKNNLMKRIHKFSLRKKNFIKNFGFDSNLTEKEMSDIAGFRRIWDCGLIKYTLNLQ